MPCKECPEHEMQLLPENQKVAEIFMLCRTQWRVAPLGGLLGLDMTGVKSTLELAGVPLSREDLDKLLLMEGQFMDGLREVRDKNAKFKNGPNT